MCALPLLSLLDVNQFGPSSRPIAYPSYVPACMTANSVEDARELDVMPQIHIMLAFFFAPLYMLHSLQSSSMSVRSWNTMIAGFTRSPQPQKTLLLYSQMMSQ